MNQFPFKSRSIKKTPHLKQLVFIVSFILTSLAGRGADRPSTETFNLSIFLTSNPNTRTLVIPIKRIQNLIVIEAQLDTTIGNFILDTGSPYLILNKTYFRYGRKLDNKFAASASGTASVPILRTNVNNLAIRELYFKNLQADLSDLGHIENHRGIKILGLLGVSLFVDFEMIIDLHRDVLYLHRLDRKGQVPEEERIVKSAPLLKVPFMLESNIITVTATVAGKKLNFCVDTGAETNALNSALPEKVLQTFQVSKRMTMLGSTGARSEVLLGTVDEMTVGAKSFKNLNAVITRLRELGEGYGRPIDGILGSNFLVKGIISINFVTKELCMYPYEVDKP